MWAPLFNLKITLASEMVKLIISLCKKLSDQIQSENPELSDVFF